MLDTNQLYFHRWWPLVGGIAAATVSVAVGTWWWYRASPAGKAVESMTFDIKETTLKAPSEWVPVAKVSSIFIYPVKSTHAVSVQEAICTPHGLKSGSIRDRVFMVIDENHKFVSGKVLPKLVLVSSKLEGDTLYLSAPGQESLIVNLKEVEQENNIITCRMRADDIDGLDLGNKVSEWLTAFACPSEVGIESLHIVYHYRNQSTRKWEESEAFPLLKASDNSFYADMTAGMLLSEGSVEDLNSRLKSNLSGISVGKGVTPLHFRPNILVSECEPYAEDQWKWMRIGEVIMRQTGPCSRCVFTTVDPVTAIKNPSGEPLKTLRRYRQTKDPAIRAVKKDSPMFGINISFDTQGIICVGDVIYSGIES